MEDGSISLLFNRDHLNSHSVADIMDSIQSFVAPPIPICSYLRTVLHVDAKLSAALPAIPHICQSGRIG